MMMMVMMMVQAPPQPLSRFYSLDCNSTGRDHPKIGPNVLPLLIYLLIKMFQKATTSQGIITGVYYQINQFNRPKCFYFLK